MSSFRRALLLLFTLAHVCNFAAEHAVVFEQHLADADPAEIREAEWFYPITNRDFESIKSDLTKYQWPACVQSIEIGMVSKAERYPISVAENPNVEDGRVFVRLKYLGITLISHNFPDSILKKYSVDQQDSAIAPSTDISKLREKYKTSPIMPTTIREELRYAFNPVNPHLRPYLRTTSLDRRGRVIDYKTIEDTYKKYAVGKNIGGFSYVSPVIPFQLTELSVRESFQSEKRRVAVRHFFPTTENSDDFLTEQLSKYKWETVDAKTGYLIHAYQERGSGEIKEYAQIWLWKSTDSHVVIIYENCEKLASLHDLSAFYLDKFPSTIDAKFTIDLDTWSRRCIETSLKKMDSAFGDEPDDPFAVDAFYIEWTKIEDVVELPPLPTLPAYPAPIKNRKDVVERFKAWWHANQEFLYWDSKVSKLHRSAQAKPKG